MLGEACLVEVGQGIQLLGGEPMPRPPRGEESLNDALQCRTIFIFSTLVFPPLLTVSVLFYCLNVTLSSRSHSLPSLLCPQLPLSFCRLTQTRPSSHPRRQRREATGSKKLLVYFFPFWHKGNGSSLSDVKNSLL